MKWLLLLAAIVVVALLATRSLWRAAPPRPPATASAPEAAPYARTRAVDCEGPAAFRTAAAANARSLTELDWAPFGVAERGWDAYEPVIAAEVGTPCPPQSGSFAAAVATWQDAHGLPASGLVEPATAEKMRVIWMLRRPFVRATRSGQCPAGPDAATLAAAAKGEGFWGKAIVLQPEALAAYRRLAAAARKEVPAARANRQLLTIVSGYRSPAENGARCAGGGCGGPARANCSAHQTGTAIDLYLGAVAGSEPTDSRDPNRSWQAGTPTYRWLVQNARRFGFVGYPYEPWHWEYAG
jgi:zinc D-Ala-D-Ala carboxypeptidase